MVLDIPITHSEVKFQSNHNGGSIRFGQDGNLYLSVGDGGGGGDPSETGQDNTDLLGSVLRLNVTGEPTYAVPGDNPFAGGGDPGNDLVWAYGLRNPWRMSVDSDTGGIWLGDVGQGSREEVDQIVAGGNYGWDCKEGLSDYEIDGCPDDSAFVAPRATYGHGGGNQAVTGGYVYRGSDMPELDGWYIYADAYSGRFWAVNTVDTNAPVQLLDTIEFIYSFAELADGELLVLTLSGIYRLAHA
jgi:glucose/arabinose dehydrogenase